MPRAVLRTSNKGVRMPLVSIIVPVYKAQDTLAQCLDSLLAQTQADLEVVCVNDGSPDGCADILASYAARDERMRVLTQQNQGVSAARNAGMDAAAGDIVMFADCDDAFEPYACQVVTDAFSTDPQLDALVFGAACEPLEETPKHVRDLLSPANAEFVREPAGRVDPQLFFGAHAQPYAWRSAYRRDFLNRERVRFVPGLALAEDAEFQVLAYSLARKTRLISAKLYRYRMDSGSATHTFNASASRARKVEQHLMALEALVGEWHERNQLRFYGPQLVAWCLDLTLFDIARLPGDEATALARRLRALLAGAYGPGWVQLPEKGAVRKGAQAVDAAERGTFRMGKPVLVAFFVATRGLRQCIERFV